MAIKKSAKKAFRQSLRRKKKNIIKKIKIKKTLRELRALIDQKKFEEAKKLLPQAYKALDKASKTGVIKKNNASRRKADLSKLFEKRKD
jgi:small subunit ribosomal protein S20